MDRGCVVVKPIDPSLTIRSVAVYQAPIPKARKRFTRVDAAKDWAHWLVSGHLARRCRCGDRLCEGHAAEKVWKEANGDLIADVDPPAPRGVFHPEVRRRMKQRVAAMLLGGWVPSAELTEELDAARWVER
jgi:hypothetical protein